MPDTFPSPPLPTNHPTGCALNGYCVTDYRTDFNGTWSDNFPESGWSIPQVVYDGGTRCVSSLEGLNVWTLTDEISSLGFPGHHGIGTFSNAVGNGDFDCVIAAWPCECSDVSAQPVDLPVPCPTDNTQQFSASVSVAGIPSEDCWYAPNGTYTYWQVSDPGWGVTWVWYSDTASIHLYENGDGSYFVGIIPGGFCCYILQGTGTLTCDEYGRFIGTISFTGQVFPGFDLDCSSASGTVTFGP